MTHISPAVYTFWSCLSTSLLCFLVNHLWKFDKFLSLRWSHQTPSGAFKRVMTYAYLVSVPLITAYSIGMCVVKYREGYTRIPDFAIIPTPHQLWTPQDISLIVPLAMILSVAWSLEIVSHLEELCFWLFLVSAESGATNWFRSIYFKSWAFGSILALAGLPTLTWATRANPLKCEAYSILAGSIGSLLVTIASIRVLFAIPNLISCVKQAGAEPEVIVRLTKFHDLNVKRIIFRFFFVVPLLTLAVDGTREHRHVNESALWTDLLATIGGFGMVTSSMLTLLIFFPRSIEREAGYVSRRRSSTGGPEGRSEEISMRPIKSGTEYIHADHQSPVSDTDLPERPTRTRAPSYPPFHQADPHSELNQGQDDRKMGEWEMMAPTPLPQFSLPGPGDYGYGRQARPKIALQIPRPQRNDVHPMIMNFRSPIDVSNDPQYGHTMV